MKSLTNSESNTVKRRLLIIRMLGLYETYKHIATYLYKKCFVSIYVDAIADLPYYSLFLIFYMN
jgi:hypothetical protein